MKPVRMQRKRTKGWNMQKESCRLNGLDATYVGRPTKWGNPFVLLWDRTSVCLYEDFLREREGEPFNYMPALMASGLTLSALIERQTAIIEHIDQLRGKNLVCWCPLTDDEGKPYPCHADVLLELANKEEPK